MAEQHSQTADYENRYKFTGHELDRETGLYYAGARYYDPKISIWLSVDPLLEKYKGLNPYIYCFNNPAHYIDSDGREPTPYEAALMAANVYGDSKHDLAGGWRVSNAGKGINYVNNYTG
jgi:RHS repeat-associated protein